MPSSCISGIPKRQFLSSKGKSCLWLCSSFSLWHICKCCFWIKIILLGLVTTWSTVRLTLSDFLVSTTSNPPSLQRLCTDQNNARNVLPVMPGEDSSKGTLLAQNCELRRVCLGEWQGAGVESPGEDRKQVKGRAGKPKECTFFSSF